MKRRGDGLKGLACLWPGQLFGRNYRLPAGEKITHHKILKTIHYFHILYSKITLIRLGIVLLKGIETILSDEWTFTYLLDTKNVYFYNFLCLCCYKPIFYDRRKSFIFPSLPHLLQHLKEIPQFPAAVCHHTAVNF